MDRTKKAIEEQSPIAFFEKIEKGIAYYFADLTSKRVHFHIPIEEMGDHTFRQMMKAPGLIRWVKK